MQNSGQRKVPEPEALLCRPSCHCFQEGGGCAILDHCISWRVQQVGVRNKTPVASLQLTNALGRVECGVVQGMGGSTDSGIGTTHVGREGGCISAGGQVMQHLNTCCREIHCNQLDTLPSRSLSFYLRLQLTVCLSE